MVCSPSISPGLSFALPRRMPKTCFIREGVRCDPSRACPFHVVTWRLVCAAKGRIAVLSGAFSTGFSLEPLCVGGFFSALALDRDLLASAHGRAPEPSDGGQRLCSLPGTDVYPNPPMLRSQPSDAETPCCTVVTACIVYTAYVGGLRVDSAYVVHRFLEMVCRINEESEWIPSRGIIVGAPKRLRPGLYRVG